MALSVKNIHGFGFTTCHKGQCRCRQECIWVVFPLFSQTLPVMRQVGIRHSKHSRLKELAVFFLRISEW